MESRCDTALSTLGSLTEGIIVEEYSYFDSLLGVCKSLHPRTYLTPLDVDVLEESNGGIQSSSIRPSCGRNHDAGAMVEGSCRCAFVVQGEVS